MPDISINLRADPSDFERGTEAAAKAVKEWEKATVAGTDDVAEKFEDVIRTLVNLAKQTGKSRTEIVRDLEYVGLGAKDAEEAISAIERETETLGDKAPKDIKRVDTAVGDAGDGIRNLGDIARSVLEGDFAGATESAINSLMGLAGAIGGGALGGAITVALGGLLGNFVASWSQAAKDSEDRVSDMYQNMIEDGEAFITTDRVQKNLIAQTAEDINRSRDRALALAIDEQVIRRAMAGDESAIRDILDITTSRREAEVQAVRDSGESLEYQQVLIDGINTKYGTTLDWLNRQLTEQEKVKGLYDSTQDAIAGLGEATREQIDRTASASQSRYEGLAALYGQGVKVPVTVDISAAERSFNALQQRASRGINIAFNSTGRMTWE